MLDGLQPKKLPVFVHVDDEIDLDAFRSHGLQPNEQELPATAQATRNDDGVDENAVRGMIEIGFTRHQAVFSLKKHSNNTNAAAEWLFMNAHEVPGECWPSVEARDY